MHALRQRIRKASVRAKQQVLPATPLLLATDAIASDSMRCERAHAACELSFKYNNADMHASMPWEEMHACTHARAQHYIIPRAGRNQIEVVTCLETQFHAVLNQK